MTPTTLQDFDIELLFAIYGLVPRYESDKHIYFDKAELRKQLKQMLDARAIEELEKLANNEFFNSCQGCSCDASRIIEDQLAQLKGKGNDNEHN